MIENKKESGARNLMQDAEDIRFREKVRTRIVQVLAQESAMRFEHILKRSLNCDPAFLLNMLHEMQDDDSIFCTEDRDSRVRYSLRERAHHTCQKATGPKGFATKPSVGRSRNSIQPGYLRELLREMFDSLPEEAPVYSQWWFSESIYEDLIKVVLQLSEPRAPLAFFGCGTLGAVLSRSCTNPVKIFDVDGVLLEKIRRYCSKSSETIRYDVSSEPDKCFNGAFQVVFVDPPWASSVLRTFLVRSSMFVSRGGSLAISFPPILTRPSVEEERKELLNLAKNLGLSLKLTLPGFTEYSVPAFERNAYRHCGIELQDPWRRGDLFIFSKSRDSSIDISDLVDKTCEWSQYEYRKCRLFMKRDGLFEDGPPSVHPIPGVDDLVYKSASTRMSFWKSASLVSTRNRIACAHGRRELSALFQRAFGQNHSNRNNYECGTSMMPIEIQESIFSMLNVSNL